MALGTGGLAQLVKGQRQDIPALSMALCPLGWLLGVYKHTVNTLFNKCQWQQKPKTQLLLWHVISLEWGLFCWPYKCFWVLECFYRWVEVSHWTSCLWQREMELRYLLALSVMWCRYTWAERACKNMDFLLPLVLAFPSAENVSWIGTSIWTLLSLHIVF